MILFFLIVNEIELVFVFFVSRFPKTADSPLRVDRCFAPLVCGLRAFRPMIFSVVFLRGMQALLSVILQKISSSES